MNLENNSFVTKIRLLFFSYNGRIGRRWFWLATLANWTVTAIVSIVFFIPALLYESYYWVNDSFGVMCVSIIAVISIMKLYIEFMIDIKRLHDMGCSGYWSLCLLVPGISFIYLLIIGFTPGKVIYHKYGARVV